MSIVSKKLEEIEKKIFLNKTLLLDSANLILKYGMEGYALMIKQVNQYNPKKIISRIDASAKYKVKGKFGDSAFHLLNDLIQKGEIECSPSRSECDVYLIQANIMILESCLLSNDSFSDYHPYWVNSLNLVKFMKIDSRFYFNLDLKLRVNKKKVHLLSSINKKREKNGVDQEKSTTLDILDQIENTKGVLELF